MSTGHASCSECGFQNPPSWVNCARCGELLGPRHRSDSTFATVTASMGLPAEPSAAKDRPSCREDEKTGRFSTEAAASHDPFPLLGQDEVLRSIRRALRQSFAGGRARVLGLTGPRGSGRTRLLVAASQIAAQGWPRVRVLYAVARQREDGPYAPFSRLLLQRFEVTPSSSLARVRAAMAEAVGEALGEVDSAEIWRTTHLLGYVAGIPFPESPLSAPPQVTAGLLAEATDAVVALASSDAKQRPTLLLLDDFRGRTVESLTVLKALALMDAPVLVVAAGAEEIAARLAECVPEDRLEIAAISPLSLPEVHKMAEAMVPQLHPPPEEFLRALQHRSGGNPSALAELIRALRDSEVFRRNEDDTYSVQLQGLSQEELPLDMTAAIRARLLSLSSDERRVIEHAAVMGERFWEAGILALGRADSQEQITYDAVLGMLDLQADELALHSILGELERKRFIVRLADAHGSGLTEYTFYYEGTREVVYNDLPEEQRVRKHALVASWLSAVKGLEGVPGLVAPHFARARLPQRAARAYLEAAQEERLRKRTTMALRLVDKALDIALPEDGALRLSALQSRGNLLTTLGRYEEAIEAFAAMLREAHLLVARPWAAVALSALARVYRQRGELGQALSHLRGALSLFRATSDEAGVASTYDDMAQIYRFNCQPELALAAAKEALALRLKTTDKAAQAASINTIGNIELDLGNFTDAESRLQLAIKLRTSIGDHEGVVQSQLGLARLAMQRGNPDAALQLVQPALASAGEMDNQRLRSYLLIVLGEANTSLGKREEAAAALTEARALALSMRDQRALYEVELDRGLLMMQAGDPEAEATLKDALGLAEAYGTRQALGLAHRALARYRQRTLYDTGDTPKQQAELERHGDAAIGHFQASGAAHELARTRAELGLSAFERGDSGRARALLELALPTLTALRMREEGLVVEALSDLNRESLVSAAGAPEPASDRRGDG